VTLIYGPNGVGQKRLLPDCEKKICHRLHDVTLRGNAMSSTGIVRSARENADLFALMAQDAKPCVWDETDRPPLELGSVISVFDSDADGCTSIADAYREFWTFELSVPDQSGRTCWILDGPLRAEERS